MDKVNKDNLFKVIKFLKNLPAKQFDFRYLVKEYNIHNHCGTVCCVIGWTPSIFPDKVAWEHIGIQMLVNKEDGRSYEFNEIAELLFGIDRKFASALFTPSLQHLVHRELEQCSHLATPKQVAKMLEKFTQLVKDNKIVGHCL